MFYADTIGLTAVVTGIERFSREQGAQYWTPTPLLVNLAQRGSTFAEWDRSQVGRSRSDGGAAMKLKSYVQGRWIEAKETGVAARDATTGAVIATVSSAGHRFRAAPAIRARHGRPGAASSHVS